MSKKTPTVAVVGLGVLGLVTVKNLLEEEFDVTGFDRNKYIGGLWHYTDEDKTSVLPTTVINISKERGCFTDFPFSDDTPSHCTGSDVQRYLESFAKHFNLMPRLRLGTGVSLVKRDDGNDRWEVRVDDAAEPLYFDKVVICTGINKVPNVPDLPRGDIFRGERLHSRAFKKPELFNDRKVVVVGLGNTGADTIAALRGIAEKIYISHSHGSIVLPRVMNGIPFDHTMTARKLRLAGWLELNAHSVFEFMFNKGLLKMQNSAFKMQPEWRLSPAPSIKHAVPIISDNLVDMLAAGEVTSVHGIKKAIGPNEVEFLDGTVVEVDTIIYCTGYKTDFAIIDSSVDPTRNTTPEWAASVGSKGKHLPRLYKGIISLDHPKSLAFMGNVAFATGAFPLYDLASMALAQIWKGNTALPSLAEINQSVDVHHAWMCSIAREGPVPPGWVRQADWLAWANDAAGTGINEKLGWGAEGWRFWMSDRAWCDTLMDGILSPHIYRLFEGKRKRWDGARQEIEKVNQRAAERKQMLGKAAEKD